MVEERVTPHQKPADTSTTAIQEGPARSDIGAGWLFGIVLLIAVLAVGYLLAIRNHGEAARNQAIVGATTEVSAAAGKVGNAAEEAVRP